jgi:hypothetical protein
MNRYVASHNFNSFLTHLYILIFPTAFSQADLYDWILPLNAIDAALAQLMYDYPALLLIGQVKRSNSKTFGTDKKDPPSHRYQAASEAEANSVPPSIVHATGTILRFTSLLLKHSVHKFVFNSVRELTNLLAAADDTIAALALETLSAFSLPSKAHRQPIQELHNHPLSALQNSEVDCVHSRLMALAKGWGSRGCGLGLVECVTVDDSPSGQGLLPKFAGQCDFEFLPPNSSQALSIHLSMEDIVMNNSVLTTTGDRKAEKRRKTTVSDATGITHSTSCHQIKSTSHLFFHCLDQIGGKENISTEKAFSLLAHIRLAASFHSHSSRVEAIERRLTALVALIYAHPSMDILAGYFLAQPELCVELADLLRPTVSSSAISSATSKHRLAQGAEEARETVVSALVDAYCSADIPYSVRMLALEIFTALITRKESGTGSLSLIAKQTHALAELGLGKNQFSGLLPTLVRYALASLNSFCEQKQEQASGEGGKCQAMDTDDWEHDSDAAIGFQLGLTFLEATKPPPENQQSREVKALDFIESIILLAMATVSVPSGTSTLTDCGLVPAILTNISRLDYNNFAIKTKDGEDASYIRCMLIYICGLAIQTLDAAIVTQNQILSTIQELKGIEFLTSSLYTEVHDYGTQLHLKGDPDVVMEGEVIESDSKHPFALARKVLIFSILNCLSIIFHHQENSSRSSTSSAVLSGSAQLQTKHMTESFIIIMDNVQSFGGVIASSISTLLSDIMNNDPLVVHHVHSSGLADSFVKMLKHRDDESKQERTLPPVMELIMSLPQTIAALSLTTDGATAIKDANPFPELLSIFCCPKYAMPHSRCLLNDMAVMIGNGLDELMRHVDSLKSLVLGASVSFIKNVVSIGKQVVKDEIDYEGGRNNIERQEVEKSRSCFIQYAHNVGQIVEQVLQADENCAAFAEAGGVEAILNLFPLLMPNGKQLLSYLSCHSSPSTASLTHSTTATTLMTAIRKLAAHTQFHDVMDKITASLKAQLCVLDADSCDLWKCMGHNQNERMHHTDLDVVGLLDQIPKEPLHALGKDELSVTFFEKLSSLLRSILSVEWTTQVLASIIRLTCHRNRDVSESGWMEVISSDNFQALYSRLSTLHRSSMVELSRARSQREYNNDLDRLKLPGDSKSYPALYKLRVVCPEGAVVRNGIDIDSCTNVGSLEMGEIVEAYERCVNLSGIMRYRTSRGWISEQTRGHGQEPISEVFHIEGMNKTKRCRLNPTGKKVLSCGIPDLCSIMTTVLSRIQNSQYNLCSSISRATMVGLRSICAKSSNAQQESGLLQVSSLISMVSDSIRLSFDEENISTSVGDLKLSNGGKSMYFGIMLNILSASLFEERREAKPALNIPMMCNIIIHDGINGSPIIPGLLLGKPKQPSILKPGIFSAVKHIIEFSLSNTADLFDQNRSNLKRQCLSREVASSLPSAISFLRKLAPRSFHCDQQLSTLMSKMSSIYLYDFLFRGCKMVESDGSSIVFSNILLNRSLNCIMGTLTYELWSNPLLKKCPAHIVNPVVSLIADTLSNLEPDAKSSRNELGPLESRREVTSTAATSSGTFRPSEDTVRLIVGMGFNRELALQAIQGSESNDVQVAMEYALAHPPSNVPDGITEQQTIEQHTNSVNNSQLDNSSSDTFVDGSTEKGDNEEKQPSEEEIKEVTIKQMTVKSLVLSKECFERLQKSLVSVAIDMIEGSKVSVANHDNGEETNFLDEGHAVTIVVCTFLLGLCENKSIERPQVVKELLRRTMSYIDMDHSVIKSDGADQFASLCHGLVLILRSLPRLRSLALKNNLVTCLVDCIRNVTLDFVKIDCVKATSHVLPTWMSSALLLLDIMAHPIAISIETDDQISKDDKNESSKTPAISRRSEYTRVLSEHKRQQSLLLKVSRRITLSLDSGTAVDKKKLSEGKESTKGSAGRKESSGAAEIDDKALISGDTTEKISKGTSEMPNFSILAPLMTQETTEQCLVICLDLLRFQQKPENEDSTLILPPSVIHSIFLLLTRLLRSQKVASLCLRLGGAELLLSPHSKSRFKGHVGLLTSVLRRMLEDEFTLQTAMVTEIRGTVTKLAKRSARGSETKVTTRGFIQAVAPLICRDPLVFMKAAAISIRLGPSSDSNNPQEIILLTPEERATNTKALEGFRSQAGGCSLNVNVPSKSSMTAVSTPTGHKRRSGSRQKISSNVKQNRTKSPHRYAIAKRNKKDRQDLIHIQGTPVNHVVSLLLTRMLESAEKDPNLGVSDDLPFLCILDFLEIISDLVLAIPACAATIHKYNPQTRKSPRAAKVIQGMQHAIHGCSSPPQNFVSYILHRFLPQPRIEPNGDEVVWDHESSEEYKSHMARKRETFMRSKISQSAARLLVSLVARSGEGRRRVISDLSLALSGKIYSSKTIVNSENNGDTGMWALQVSVSHQFKNHQ